jgi:nucleotidyltransferase/DNA polymerase involved in DNA repair
MDMDGARTPKPILLLDRARRRRTACTSRPDPQVSWCGNTFSADIFTFEAACEVLQPIIEKVWRTCEGAEIRGRTVTLKVKHADFQQITRSRTGQALFSTRAEIEQLRPARATVPGHKRHPPSWHDVIVARREATGKRAPIQPVILG